MSIHVALRHVTHYQYERPVQLGPQTIRLRPAPHTRTPILSYSLVVLPQEHFLNWQQDPQGNWLARLVFPEKTDSLKISVDLVSELSVINPFDFFLEPYAESFPFAYESIQHDELLPYLGRQPLTPALQAYLHSIPATAPGTMDFLVQLNQRLQREIRYTIRLEPGVQTPEQTLTLQSGSCRDSAWLLVQLLRQLGLAARFVSGYLIQLKPDVMALQGPPGPGADFTDLHAWTEVYLPGAGWVGLDPTSGLLAGEGHIPLACAPDPVNAAPLSGLIVDPASASLQHEMTVERVWQAPRVTLPYTEAQWARIDALGQLVDRHLQAHDVRLTMGGEPTFVSLQDRDGAEWNTAALGPTKRHKATDLFQRLKAEYAPQGLAHFGQGKWYPGEQLPRWALSCYWRRDGRPLVTTPLYADEAHPDGADAARAGLFLRTMADYLALGADLVFPAFEDLYYYLWREQRLPRNVLPTDPRLQDPLERERLMRLFNRGLSAITGYVLPVAKGRSGAWQSGAWYLRTEQCFLLPGDSPMGYRLPLDSLPWCAPADYPYVHAPDPFQTRSPVPDWQPLQARATPFGSTDTAPRLGESAPDIVRTALCAEPRNGVLYLFMPPTGTLEDYLELVSAAEATARHLSQPIIFEGYPPPSDPRLIHFSVTPDPGVIEVNVHPANTWEEMVERASTLYGAARQCGLGSEKFMLDGRHTGTGGGNHLVLGGATPADSPLLRRPDLLASLVAYWHHHPSLSYLFSGLFIGPTSQAPRLDEAGHDALHDLEIALAHVPQPGEAVSPWLIDRLLRHLLTDRTGNTHRAEFCIDKLYAPEGVSGRLGLLEMRAFEMPPHERMALTQQLLIRALVARFWQQPYRPGRLRRWGTELHDRFLLPYFVQQDFADVLEELRALGYPFENDWFDVHRAFRFPFIGEFSVRGIHVQLHHALEPWPVLGEEGSSVGTVRYVDSSLERIQVLVMGLNDERHRLTVNGHTVPLQPTGVVGEAVAGVRFRAWQPSSCLHPTIGVHAPLTFDLVDTWMQRSLGGCQYHVAHPGGRNHERLPINAQEAEGRRQARFFRMGHSIGPVFAPDFQRDPDFPFTLDLRLA